MRLTIFAGLAALARATDFDDDDMNFLRMLSSNASGNGTTVAPTTTVAANTTLAPTTTVAANTTLAPTTTLAATTTVAAGNTTLAPTTTAAPAGNTTMAAETMAPTTVAGGDDHGDHDGDHHGTHAPATTLCSAATYESVHLKAPATIAATSEVIGIHLTSAEKTCELDEKTAAMYEYGARAQTAANKAKCADATFLDVTCGTESALTYFNKQLEKKEESKAQRVLAACCGAPASWGSLSLGGTVTQGGTWTMGEYTDSACTTANTIKEADSFGDKDWYGVGGDKVLTLNLGSCYDLRYLTKKGVMIGACNGTHKTTFMYWSADCSGTIHDASVDGLNVECTEDKRRMLGAHGNSTDGGSTKTYSMNKCDGGTAVTEMEILADLEITLTGLVGVVAGSPEAASIVTTTSESVRAEIATTAGDGTTTVIESATGTGVLAAARRRLSQRMLASHNSGSVVTVTKTTVPAAQAATIKTTMAAAASGGGALDAATLQGTVVTALKAAPDIAAAVANVTATVANPINIAEPSIAAPTPGGAGPGAGSTSGAATEYLSVAAGLVFAAAMMM